MSSALKNLSEYILDDHHDGSDLHLGIAVSVWNEEITASLLKGCVDTLLKHGVLEKNLTISHVPGAFELPMACKMMIQNKKQDAVIALGCVIQGDTKHDDYINNAVASGLIQLSLVSNIPCIYGVVTTNTQEQALERSGGKHGNKGIESAITALKMANLSKNINNSNTKIGF